jgi:hypothetical protein
LPVVAAVVGNMVVAVELVVIDHQLQASPLVAERVLSQFLNYFQALATR